MYKKSIVDIVIAQRPAICDSMDYAYGKTKIDTMTK